jgi:hypothetical protein
MEHTGRGEGEGGMMTRSTWIGRTCRTAADGLASSHCSVLIRRLAVGVRGGVLPRALLPGTAASLHGLRLSHDVFVCCWWWRNSYIPLLLFLFFLCSRIVWPSVLCNLVREIRTLESVRQGRSQTDVPNQPRQPNVLRWRCRT